MPYTYHQSHQQITLLCEVGWETRSSDVELLLGPDSIVAGVKGAAPLLRGRLVAPIVPAASTWFLERRPGDPRSGRATTRSSTQSSSSQRTGEDALPSNSSPPRRSSSPGSASSFDLVGASQPASHPSSLASFATGVRDDRRGPASEGSSFGSSGEWAHGGGTSDEGELVGHPSPQQAAVSSPSASQMSNSGFLPAQRDHPDNESSAPPSLEASSILQPPSEESANTFSTTSTGSAPASQSSTGSPRTPEVHAGAPPPTRLLTLHLVKATPKIWESLVIVDGIDGAESAPGVPDMDPTSLAALASELVHRGFDARERAFGLLLHAHSVGHLPLASHLLLQHFFAPPILTPSGDDEALISPSHILRLGGKHELAAFYLQAAHTYLVGPLPPPPPHHRFPTSGAGHRPTAAQHVEIAKQLLTRAVLADPHVAVDDPDLKALAKGMGFRRGKSGVWRRLPARGAAKGRGQDFVTAYGLYLVVGAVLAGAAALWWRRKAPPAVPSWREFREEAATAIRV